MTDVTDERWAQHSTILTLKGELAKAQAENRTLRNAALDLEQREAALREALAFYRDGWVSSPNRRYGGLDWHPKESLLDDCGNVAKSALEAKS